MSANDLKNNDVTESSYSESKYQDHLFEQYKLYVELADRVSERRLLTNNVFLTLTNTITLGFFGFILKDNVISSNAIILFPLLIALLICYQWRRLVYSYKQLVTAKFMVIHDYEKYLPSTPFFGAEWKALGEGKDAKLYRPVTRLETSLPLAYSHPVSSSWVVD